MEGTLNIFFVAKDDTRTTAGRVGLERYSDVGLLRSLLFDRAREMRETAALRRVSERRAAPRNRAVQQVLPGVGDVHCQGALNCAVDW
jgi:hypothetical protein